MSARIILNTSLEDRSMTSRTLNSHAMPARGLSSIAARDWDSTQFRFIFTLSFLFYFVTSIGARFTPAFWRNASSHRSILGDAIESAGTMAQIAFHG